MVNRLGATIPVAKSPPTPEPKPETKETGDTAHEDTSSSKSQEEPSKVESEPESELGKYLTFAYVSQLIDIHSYRIGCN